MKGLKMSVCSNRMMTRSRVQAAVLGLLAVARLAAAAPENNCAEEVFCYERTVPVVGRPEIRGALPAGARHFKPVQYQADKGGWVAVADSFEAYNVRREVGATNDQPALVEIRKAENANLQLPPLGLSAQPVAPGLALLPVSHPTLAASIKKPAAHPLALPTEIHRQPNDPVIYFRRGDEARVHAAARKLCAEGLPITQANMNRELGYASTPPGPQPSGSQGSNGRASVPVPGSHAPVNKAAGAGQVGPRPTERFAAAQPASPPPQGNHRVVISPLPPSQVPAGMLVQPAGAGWRRSTTASRR